MLRAVILGLAGGLALGAPAARAEPVLDGFKAFCVDKHNLRAEPLASADAAGWSPLPREFLAQAAVIPNAKDTDGRMKAVSGGVLILFVGRTSELTPAPLANADVCAVITTSGDEAAVRTEGASFADVPEKREEGSPVSLYVWRDDSGKHVNIAAAELAQGRLPPHANILIAGGRGAMAYLALAAPFETSPH